MKKLIFFALFIAFLSCQSCPQDVCKDETGVKTGCRIPVVSANQNNLQGCLSGFTCSAEVNDCVLIDPYRLQRPGENCYHNSDCVTNFCVLGCQSGKDCQTNNTCQTQLTNLNCTSDIQCPANHRCLFPKGSTTNKLCLPLSGAGTNCADTQNSTWCTWGTLCASTDEGHTYQCTQAFSVAARSKLELYNGVAGTVDTMAHLCSTGYYNTSNNTCAVSAKTLTTYPKACRTSEDCPVNDDNGYDAFYKGQLQACVCSTINKNGLGFCQPTDQDSGYLGRLRSAYGASYSTCAPWQISYRESGCQMNLDAMDVDISTSDAIKDNNCYVTAGLWPYSSFDALLTPPSSNQCVCPNYTCNNYNTYFDLEKGACIVYNQGSFPHTYDIYNCPNGYYCQATVGSQATANIQYSYCLYPGDDCMNDQECYTGHCVAGICIVQNKTNACTHSSECGRGLYCKSSACAEIIAEGGACSTSNYTDCIDGTLCLQQNGQKNYQCTYAYSQAGGQKFSLIVGGTTYENPGSGMKAVFDAMCQSASYNSSSNQCNNDPERTQGGWTKQCANDQECIGTYATASKCNCYPNTELNKQYCVGFPVENDPCFSKAHGQAQRNLYGCYPFEYQLQGACGSDTRCDTNNPVPSGQRGSCYSLVFGNSYLTGKGGNGALLIANHFAIKFSMLVLGMILIFILI